jgi:hypothetical protein
MSGNKRFYAKKEKVHPIQSSFLFLHLLSDSDRHQGHQFFNVYYGIIKRQTSNGRSDFVFQWIKRKTDFSVPADISFQSFIRIPNTIIKHCGKPAKIFRLPGAYSAGLPFS